MPDLSLEQYRAQYPYVQPRRVAGQYEMATIITGAGYASALVSVVAVLVHWWNYHQAVREAANLCTFNFVCPPAHISAARMMLAAPWWYLAFVLAPVLLVAGKKLALRARKAAGAARRAHDESVRDKFECALIALREEPFKLLHYRSGWWLDGPEVVIGIVIEFRDMHMGGRQQLTIPMRRITWARSLDDTDHVFFPERMGVVNLGEAAHLLLAHPPLWLWDLRSSPRASTMGSGPET